VPTESKILLDIALFNDLLQVIKAADALRLAVRDVLADFSTPDHVMVLGKFVVTYDEARATLKEADSAAA
jgi:hypothetical protein